MMTKPNESRKRHPRFQTDFWRILTRPMRRACLTLFTLLVFSAISTTALARASFSPADSPQLNDEAAFASFRDDVYPALRMHCAQCHSSEAIFPHGPDHSDGNAHTAFSTFQRFVDYSDPDHSRILEQLRNAHYCKDHGAHCGDEMKIRADLEPKILDWITRTTPKDLPDPNATSEFTVPDSHEFDATFALKTLPGIEVRDLNLHLKFVQYQGTAYTLRHVNAEATAGTVRISGLTLFVNRKVPSVKTGLELIDTVGTFDAWSEVAGRKVQLILTNNKPLITLRPGDRISLKYRIDNAAPAPCQAPQAFEQVVAPMVRSGVFGEANWTGLSNQEINDLFATDRKPMLLNRLCQAFEQRIDWQHPVRSVLFADLTSTPDSIFGIIKAWKKLGELLGKPVQAIKVKDVAMARIFQYGATSSNKPGTCALGIKGDLYCWGQMYAGQSSTLSYDRMATQTARVKIEEPVIQFTMGANHICALTESRQVWCWGQNSPDSLRGRRGRGGTNSTHAITADPAVGFGIISAPLHLTAFDNIGGSHVKKLVAGIAATCALTDSGKVYCWGSNQYGMLGAEVTNSEIMPPTETLPSPSWLPDGSPLPERITDITTGDFHFCAQSEAKKLYCWGLGSNGIPGDEAGPNAFQRAIGNTPKSMTNLHPALLPNPIDKAVSGSYHNCALFDGKLSCFGQGRIGELGLEKGFMQEFGSRPGEMANSTVNFPGPVIDAAAGSGVTCALTSQRSLYCWGNGQMARFLNYENQSIVPGAIRSPLGTTAGSVALSKIAWSDRIKKVAIGIGQVCAINQDDELHCWGNLNASSGVDLTLFNMFKEKGVDLGFYTRVLLLQ